MTVLYIRILAYIQRNGDVSLENSPYTFIYYLFVCTLFKCVMSYLTLNDAVTVQIRDNAITSDIGPELYCLLAQNCTVYWPRTVLFIGPELYRLLAQNCTVYQIREIKSRRMRWEGEGVVANMRERRDVYRVLLGRPEGRRPLGKTRRRWEGLWQI
jgi:hypothetical protein